MDSISFKPNQVQWTRFLGLRGHTVHLNYWHNSKTEYNILDLLETKIVSNLG